MKLDRYYMKKNIVDKIKRNKRFQFTPQNDVDEEYYEGEFYEDDGHGLYGPDCSGWTEPLHHRYG
jgi:hypothetical protein